MPEYEVRVRNNVTTYAVKRFIAASEEEARAQAEEDTWSTKDGWEPVDEDTQIEACIEAVEPTGWVEDGGT
jgi:hypothetical protein